ncbi:MAG: hypothetical protein JNM89_16785 [Hyphomicrobiaceae bacterium]|nr:hypothetical protein [Hyphomicrobiaceae bacterium]
MGTSFASPPALSQDFFRPPKANDTQRAPRNTANIDRPQQTDGWSQRSTPAEPQAIAPPPSDTLPLDRKSRAVETSDLAPVMASDGSSLPHELWLGLDVAEIEKLIGSLSIPPRSPALHGLWKRLVTASVGAPLGDQTGGHFEALRLEALYRSGLLQEIDDALKGAHGPGIGPLEAMLVARAEIGLGRREAGCERARGLSNINRDIPKSLRGEAVLVSGYCAAAEGNAAAAGLLAELAREEGITTSPGLAALDQIAVGAKPAAPKLGKEQRLSLVDYRILELAGASPPAEEMLPHATPALLAAIVRDPSSSPALRLQAAEEAARLNVIAPAALADVYRAAAKGAAPQSDAADGPERRAALVVAAEIERTPFKKVRNIRAVLDSARRAGLYVPMLTLVARLSADVGLVPEIGWFAETAIEANLAAGDFARARMWTKFAETMDGSAAGGAPAARTGMGHWMALIDIADPAFPDERGAALAAVERLALSGRFSTDALHRLATVLDALQYHVPIPLWEAASRTPQPASGYLPPTGILSQLQQASVKREFGRTVLLAMQALGPDGADHAHMIAFGDAIRALKRAGLEPDARRLALEALLGDWPRTVSN